MSITARNTSPKQLEDNAEPTTPQFSDNQLVGGSGYTVRFSPNLSPQAENMITKTLSHCSEGYIVDELLAECLEPTGSLFEVFSEEDLAIIKQIKEDYIVFD